MIQLIGLYLKKKQKQVASRENMVQGKVVGP